jgi:hypothetical protein
MYPWMTLYTKRIVRWREHEKGDVQMGPISTARRRMDYSRNVISHESFLLSELVSCTVRCSGEWNKQALVSASFDPREPNILLQRQDIGKHIIMNVCFMWQHTWASWCEYKHTNSNKIAILLNKKLRDGYHNSDHYPSSCPLFKTHDGDVRTSQETHYVSDASPRG